MNGVIVIWDGVIYFVGVIVGVEDGDDWNFEFVSFVDGEVFFFCINDLDCLWNFWYIVDIVEVFF